MASIVPVIDISPFVFKSAGAATVIEAVRDACERIGFFAITEHGVPDAVVTHLTEVSRAFFDLPAVEKIRVARTGSVVGGLTYFPLEAESLAQTRGERRPGDVKESLDYGPGFIGDAWPHNPPTLRVAWLDYYAAMHRLVRVLRGMLATAIGLGDNYFEDKFDRHHSSIRVLNYPEQRTSLMPGQVRAGAHTDYGFLTVLRSENRPGGLQVQARGGAWVNVTAPAESFVVNIGDALMRWTNDRWISTPHRVVNPPNGVVAGTRRQSIAFFHNPNADATIRCLDGFCGPDNPPKYEPVRYGDYAALKYYQAHGETLVRPD